MAKDKKKADSFSFNSVDILHYAWDKRKPLFVITFAAIVLSIIVSLSITPKFRATAVVIPSMSNSVSKTLLANNYSGTADYYEFGTDDQAELLMQILNSDEVRDKIAEKFNLMEHYKIDSASRYPKTYLDYEYKSNVKFKLTKYMSVIIEVMDKDPLMATGIANEITVQVDSVYARIMQQRALHALQMVEQEYNDVLEDMKVYRDSLDKIMALGVINYEAQADRYHQAYSSAILAGNFRAANEFDAKLKLLAKYGGSYVALSDLILLENKRLSSIKQKHQEARLEAEQKLPRTYIVNPALQPEKKAYPRRSMIVIVSTLSAFLFGLVSLILLDTLKQKN